ncbi:MAG: hypothetical protein HZA52_17450 [Planctomycetes bacterium]|nr:hypothetical protein [Planctomycetota bacterium]
MAPTFPSFVQVLGRAHPLVLHLPIGLFVGLAVVEVLALFGWLTVSRRLVGVWVWLAALSALASTGSGWLLGHEDGYGGETLERHENLGLIVGALALIVAGLHQLSHEGTRTLTLRFYRGFVFATAALLVPTGHLGATLTHGDDFLLEPLREKPAPAPKDPSAPGALGAPIASTYATVIAPLFETRCTSCHGESKHKGKLALHTREAIEAGGESGPVLNRAQPAESELLVRVRFPVEHDDHMPPGDKPQPSTEELAALEAWILAGAPFEGAVAAPSADVAQSEDPAAKSAESTAAKSAEPAAAKSAEPAAAKSAEPGGKSAKPAPPEPKRPAADALAALDAEFAHVETQELDGNLLWIDFSALATRTDDALVTKLVRPVGEFVGELSLARSQVGAGTLELAAGLPKLRRLDLRGAPIDDAALAKLGAHPTLAELVLAQTKLTDASLDALLALPKLERVFLWKSGLSSDAIARLRSERPSLHVDAGDVPDSAPADAETEIKLTSDAPLPGAPAPESPAAALVPINTKCPVSGSPVNPKYAVVYDGKVIGFCCPNCPKEFWANPEACLAKLE